MMPHAPFDPRERWEKTCARSSSRVPRQGIDEIVRAYSESHRAYHTVEHLAECFHHLDSRRLEPEDPLLFELALWFHDLVYDPMAADNEARSADRAQQSLPDLGEAEHDRIRELILATRHSGASETGDAALLCDIDLGILASDEERYLRYEVQVRREYLAVPEDDYRAGRGRILESFLAMPRLYATPSLHAEWEEPARLRIERALDRLRDRSVPLLEPRWSGA